MDYFEKALVRKLTELREKMAAEDMKYLSLAMYVNGTVEDGALRVTLRLSDDFTTTGESAEGPSVDAVYDELLRRRKWKIDGGASIQIPVRGKDSSVPATTEK